MPKLLPSIVFWAVALLTFTPWVSAPLALVLGALVVNGIGLPRYAQPAVWVKRLLALAIVGLGFGVQLEAAWQVTHSYFGIMVVSIGVTLLLALVGGRWLRVDGVTSHLIGSGTAICGGSAIAAVAPAMHARNDQMALALACIFTLNAIALLVFPWLGHLLQLDQSTFGAWAAIAIHDTSSVVGAAQAYGDEALQTATTLKLARALWIIPLALVTAWIYQWRHGVATTRKLTVPMFIVGYMLAMACAYVMPQFDSVYQTVFGAAKKLLVFCLYLVGASITWARLRAAGWRPLVLAFSLWVVIATFTLGWLLYVATV